ncbi:lipoprotein [Spirochaetia bacterium]|nr:lipoprotein [Spirochaetia bacterium]
MKVLPLLFIPLALASGCSGRGLVSVAREDLFSLDIGRLEDQIDLSNLEGSRSNHQTSLAMRDGLFYISDTNGAKIVRYNSYGDILFVIYNEENNPPPVTLEWNIDEQGVATRWTITHPLMEPGALTVDSRKHIYVADRLDSERRGFDVESKALLDQVVLHFDADGRLVGFLGQEGLGGRPFPRITGLYASVEDELAVVCLLSDGWNIYWFNAEGTLLYLIHLPNDSIPIPPDRNTDYASVDMVAAAPDERKLFFKVDYYRNIYDESDIPSGVESDSSVIWIMGVEDGSYGEQIEVPFFEYTTTENNQKVTQSLLYSMLGVIKNGRVFLSFPVEGGYSLLVLTAGSRERRQGFIQVRSEELQYNTFNLSAEGILSGLLATEYKVKLVWWRTDRLLGEVTL